MNDEETTELAHLTTVAYIEFTQRDNTYRARLNGLLRDLIEINNSGLDVLFEHKVELAEMGILGELAEAFRRQNKKVEELAEYSSTMSDSRAQLGKDLQPVVESLWSGEE